MLPVSEGKYLDNSHLDFWNSFYDSLASSQPKRIIHLWEPQYSQLWDLRERFIHFQGRVEEVQSTSQPQLIVSEVSIYRTWSIQTRRLFRQYLGYTWDAISCSKNGYHQENNTLWECWKRWPFNNAGGICTLGQLQAQPPRTLVRKRGTIRPTCITPTYNRDTCTSMLTMTLYTTMEKWNQPQCHGQWMNKETEDHVHNRALLNHEEGWNCFFRWNW